MTKYIKFSLPLFLLLGLIILPFSTLAVVPSGTPPTCPSSNPACNPPINVGDVNQTKVGGIGVQGNLAAYGKMIISALTRLSLGNPTKGKWGGSGDKFILKSGADNNSTFPVSLGLASTHMWNSIPAGLFYAWYINGIEKMRLTDSGLDINGQIRIRGGSPGVGKVLVSDATGLASWQTGYGGLPVGTTHQTLRHDGTAWTATDVLRTGGASINVRSSSAQTGITLNNTSAGGHDFHFYSGGDASTIAPNGFVLRDNSAGANRLIINKHGNIGIGTNSPTAKLDVNGTIFSKGLVSNGSITMVDGTQGVGKVMVSDASGKGSRKTPSELGLGGSTYTVGSGLTLSSTNVFSLTHPIINFAGRNINGTLNLIEGTFSFNLIERTCPSGEFMTGILADGSIVCQSQDGGDQDLYQCPVRPNDSTCARALGAPYPASTCTGQVSSYSKCTYYGYNQVGHYCTAMQTNCTSI